MKGLVTVHMNARAHQVWNLIADIDPQYSPEVFESEWLDGATGPALGALFRGHVKRNEIGPIYWTTCRVTACEPGSRVRLRGACRPQGGEQLALRPGARRRWH